MSATALKRLRKEYRDINAVKGSLIRAAPLESNMLECHYVLQGAKGTPYEGGWYHGKLLFPPQYPFKPPGVMMCTPSGRFKVNTRLCLSLSDFHPETWNPMWSVSSILVGLQSFMVEQQATAGSITSTNAAKREFAAHSLDYNCRNKVFCELFPELEELNDTLKGAKDSSAAPQGAQQPNTTTDGVNDDWAIVDSILELGSSTFAICILVVLVSFLVYWFNIFP